MGRAANMESTDNPYLQRESRISHGNLQRLESQIEALDRRVNDALRNPVDPDAPTMAPGSVHVWGVPFSRLTLGETLLYIDQLVSRGRPGYFITANLNYVMLTSQLPELQRVNERASFIVCDGMPMVWWSRLTRTPLPERVASMP